jgi:hypothetical protein
MKKFAAVIALLAVSAMPAFAARGGKSKFVDSDDYKDKDEFRSAIIEDYTGMVEGDGIEWVWVADGVKLSDYKIVLDGKFSNKSEINDKAMVSTLNDGFDDGVNRQNDKKTKGTLKAQGGIYWAERANRGKMWIPYAGGHLAQAGVGIELILTDASGKTVAKIRHSGRQGDKPEEAAEELLDDLSAFVAEH